MEDAEMNQENVGVIAWITGLDNQLDLMFYQVAAIDPNVNIAELRNSVYDGVIKTLNRRFAGSGEFAINSCFGDNEISCKFNAQYCVVDINDVKTLLVSPGNPLPWQIIHAASESGVKNIVFLRKPRMTYKTKKNISTLLEERIPIELAVPNIIDAIKTIRTYDCEFHEKVDRPLNNRASLKCFRGKDLKKNLGRLIDEIISKLTCWVIKEVLGKLLSSDGSKSLFELADLLKGLF